MKIFSSLVLSILLAGCVGLSPHSNPSSVTDVEIGMYKFGMKKGCTDQGVSKGDDAAKVKAHCDCALNTFTRYLTREDWQAATYAAQNKLDREEARVFAPYISQIKACK